MAKKYEWKYTEEVTVEAEEGQEGIAELKMVEHTVSLVCSMLTGKAIITIDGDEFDISVGFMKLRGTNQMFRLGECAAMLDFPKKGEPRVIVDGKEL
ncbi:MAG: hypothetical protein J6Q78_04220 [Clostridia bacterium]|nr:hypothetical protein [Clostridia bacterium]